MKTRALNRYYLYALLSGLQFGWTTWLAYVVAHGGNPGWAESAFHLAILLGEVPTGVVADLIGRRRSMLIGSLVGAVASFSYTFIDGTGTAMLVLGLSGLAGTFLSGADTALLYETAHEIGGADLARRAIARTTALQMAALAVAPIIAGYLYAWNDLAPFFSRGAVSLITFAVVRGMAEKVGAGAASGPRRDVWAHTRTALRLIRQSRPLLVMLIFSWAYNAVVAMAGQFAQVYFPYTGLTMVGAGMVFTATRLAGSGAGWVAERSSSTTAMRFLRFGPLANALGYLTMGMTGGWRGAAALIAAEGADGFVYPTLQARFNAAIPSEQRATILSFQSAGFSLLMTAAFPAAAYLAPVQLIYVVIGLAALLVSLAWIRVAPLLIPSAEVPTRLPGN